MHCTEKIPIRRVTCTWWLLGLAVKPPWLGLGGQVLALAAWTGQAYKTLLSPCRGFILTENAAWALSGCLTTETADYCMLINELRSLVYLLRLEVDLSSFLESKLAQKWRYGLLNACTYRLKLVSQVKKNQDLKGLATIKLTFCLCSNYTLHTS